MRTVTIDSWLLKWVSFISKPDYIPFKNRSFGFTLWIHVYYYRNAFYFCGFYPNKLSKAECQVCEWFAEFKTDRWESYHHYPHQQPQQSTPNHLWQATTQFPPPKTNYCYQYPPTPPLSPRYPIHNPFTPLCHTPPHRTPTWPSASDCPLHFTPFSTHPTPYTNPTRIPTNGLNGCPFY